MNKNASSKITSARLKSGLVCSGRKSKKCLWARARPSLISNVMLVMPPSLFTKALLLQDNMQMNDIHTIPIHDVRSWCDASKSEVVGAGRWWREIQIGEQEKSKLESKRNPDEVVERNPNQGVIGQLPA